MMNWGALKYLPDEKIWFLSSLDCGFEVIVAGNQIAPDSDRVETAKRVVANLDEVLRAVRRSLAKKVNHQEIESSGDWHLEAIEVGRNHEDPPQEFEVVLTTDEGGTWVDCRLWLVHCVIRHNSDKRLSCDVMGYRIRGS